MSLNIIESDSKSRLHPLTIGRTLLECKFAGKTLQNHLTDKFAKFAFKLSPTVLDIFWPSDNILNALSMCDQSSVIIDEDDNSLARVGNRNENGDFEHKILIDEDSILIQYPWHLLSVNEMIVGEIDCDSLKGTVREGVTIDGHLILGEGSVILPGVYIEGNVVIGENCKIGPNCYFRGTTSVGDGCHVGQAVEVKNSILMDGVSAGHLSYIGDSIVGENTNFGAGTITANFRHDGQNHKSMVEEKLIDTGRRKFGAIIGDYVHTGIHTSIYPGRKIWPHKSTLPGDIVQKDIV